MNKLTPIKHGTYQGYKQHRYRANTGRPEDCDGSCRRAWNDYCKERKDARLRSRE